MKAYIYIIMCSLVLLTASCGQQHRAESLVEDFMEKNMHDASKLEDVSFNDIDSTRYINDSIVVAMRQMAQATAKHYKSDIDYGSQNAGKTLVMARVTYKLNGKDYTDTYYMDKEMTRVVAFKSTEK